MIMIITGVASTGGSVASLNRSARWSGVMTRLNEPVAPDGIGIGSFVPALVCLSARGLDDLGPLGGFTANIRCEFFGRAADRIRTLRDELVADLRDLQYAYDLTLKLRHDIARQIRRAEQAEPGRRLEIRKSRFGDGWYVRH